MLKQGHTHTHLNNQIFVCPWSLTRTLKLSYHPDWPAGAHVIVVGIPAVVFGVVSVLQDVLLALEGPDGRQQMKAPLCTRTELTLLMKAAVLEVMAVAADLQCPPREALALDLCSAASQSQGSQSNSCSRGAHIGFRLGPHPSAHLP